MASNISSSIGGDTSTAASTDRLREQARTVGRDLNELGNIAKSAAAEGVNTLRDQARQYGERAQEKVQEVEDSVGTYISERPIQSVLIAAGVGVALGYFLGRR
jgi:ElaB/YqjD/DUF883 family membrane-anchored ribosome-binding protein